MMSTLLLALLIFIAALLYSSVGHAGASGYLAAMGLFNMKQAVMKPAALILNIFVASIGTYRFWRAGFLSWRLLLPFIVLSIPFAFIGGKLKLSDPLYQRLLGGVLLFAAASMLWQTFMVRRGSGGGSGESRTLRPPPIPVALILGGGIGMLSGMTGVGGGIFLSPVLILAGWADPKRTAAVSAPFILVNSIAGLAGQIYTHQFHPIESWRWDFLLWLAAAIGGGLIGSWLGARRLSNPALRILLSAVLVVAGVKLIRA